MLLVTGRQLWQHAAGDTNRHYVETCLKWDVILNGPGYAGAWPACIDVLREDGWTKKKITGLKRFAEGMKHGDLVVLRVGTSEVYGVGEIVGPYLWHEMFSDIDGWNLEHVRRVRWLWKSVTPKRFPTYTVKQGDTTQRLTSKVVIDWMETLDVQDSVGRVPPQLPVYGPDKAVSSGDISEFLFDRGVASNTIRSLLYEIDELTTIARWYEGPDKKNAPSESETVAYLVVPLLRALGWTPQRMAIEWRKVDLALFARLPRSDENLEVVVEAKKKGLSCLSAVSQAESYAQGKESCERLIVTDGLRYGVFVKQGALFVRHAYLNLTSLRSDYLVYGCGGACEAILAMTPEWVLPSK